MKREAKIIHIVDKEQVDVQKKHLERIGKEGYLYTNMVHSGFPFMFEYKNDEGRGLSGSKIIAVRRLPNYIIIVTKHTIYVFKYLDTDKNFYERYKDNEATMDDVDDFVEAWHNSGVSTDFYKEQMGLPDDIINELLSSDDIGLQEYLGLTDTQYEKFLQENKI